MSIVEQLFWLAAILPLATGAVVDAWRNGSIFAGWRAVVEARAAAHELGFRGAENFLAALLDCAFCLSYHVPAWLILTQYLPSLLLSFVEWRTAARIWLLPSYALAATRVSWLVNGLAPDHLRYGYRANRGRDTYRPDAD
jgi:hypothetical protein